MNIEIRSLFLFSFSYRSLNAGSQEVNEMKGLVKICTQNPAIENIEEGEGFLREVVEEKFLTLVFAEMDLHKVPLLQPLLHPLGNRMTVQKAHIVGIAFQYDVVCQRIDIGDPIVVASFQRDTEPRLK